MKILKLALSFIFCHSLLSVTLLYTYVAWILKDEEERSLQASLARWSQNEPLVWPNRVRSNVLSNDVLRPDEFGIRGWWMAHNKWTTEVECFNQEWGTCVKVFSIPCRVDSVRSIYQWIPLRHDSKVKGFELSLRSAATDLRREASDALYGALALVKLTDGSSHTVTIRFPEDPHALLLKHAEFVASANTAVTSITVMLCCYGFVGTAKFTDIVLELTDANKQETLQPSSVALCPKVPLYSKPAMLPKYRVEVLDYTSYNVTNYRHKVTLVTQVTMDRLSILEKSLSPWEGPVSLAIYIPFKEQNKAGGQGWQGMYIKKKLKYLPSKSNVYTTLVYSSSASEEYPINYLRNVAIRQAATPFIFLVDADFLPAADFQSKFDIMMHAQQQSINKTAWVVPAFEYLETPSKGSKKMPTKRPTVLIEEFSGKINLEEALSLQQQDDADDFPPRTKEDLVEQVLVENTNIQPFRLTESPESHRLTDYWQWYRAEHPYRILSYSDKYEPYVILKVTSQLPLYNERFTGYGMNKVSHTTELFASGYEFKVLHDLWVLHLPHRTTSFSMAFLQSPQKRLENRAFRYEFMGEILNKYKIGPCGE